ncbi:hypothetical protein [Halarchaeum salinum]|uniref:DUF4872 domain-containing protein n=1 Tax=Halarchaeum salinum TaxID=489912 RepID=A0AAV3SA38_9EURY
MDQSATTTTVFAGIDGRADAALPEWYAAQYGEDEVVSFAEAIRSLPRAVASTVAFQNPYSGEWVETERFSALVDPERLAAHARGVDVDPLFHVPTDSYAIINPHDVYTPLEAVVADETIDGRPLGDVVFGVIRQYRGGGEVHMDVLFDGLSVTLPGRAEPIAVGFSSGYDFFGGHAVYVEGFAQDAYCANSIRALTDRRTVKHVGDVGSFETWWERLLGQLQIVADDLAAFIQDAQEITLDLREVPFDVETFYTLLDFPDYLAARAASDARAEADDPFELDMWTLHSGATHALTHFYTGKEGAALDRYVRVANDILFNPAGTLDRLTQTYRQQVRAETAGDGQTGLDGHAALAHIERVERDLRDDVAQFQTREAALRERFAQSD